MKIAWLFPGQGSQKVGMGQELAERFDAARQVFDTVDRALGFSVSELCFDGPQEELNLTANTQPALVATSIAAVEALQSALPDLPAPAYCAGHSLGEYSALTAAGALRLEDAVCTVRLRGQAMQEAVPAGKGGMLAVLGGTAEQVEALCDAAREDEVLAPANFNCPGQIVIAGHAEAVSRARSLAKESKLKAIPLPVSAPFHCELMKPAGEAVRKALSEIQISAPAVPVVANVDAAPNRDPERVAPLLIRQVDSAVRWQQCLEKMVADGVTHALELGPGRVLAGLAKKTVPELKLLSVGDPQAIDKVSEFIG